MTGYRFFFVGTDGHVTGRIEHDCDDDPAALDHAAKLATSSGVEVWVGARLVGRVTREQKPPEDSDRTSP
jgi:hypothetical protein